MLEDGEADGRREEEEEEEAISGDGGGGDGIVMMRGKDKVFFKIMRN